MIWIIVIIIVIVLIVRSNSKKKKTRQDDTATTTPPTTTTGTGSGSSTPDFSSVLDSLGGTDSTATGTGSGSSSAPDFSSVLDSLGGTDSTATGSGSGGSSAPDFSSVLDSLGGTDSTSTGSTSADDALTAAVLDYYRGMWNRDTGSLYTELDTMQIQHFGVQVKEDGLVDSVWLKGDTIPLVNEISFAKLLGSDNAPRLTSQSDRAALLARIKQCLTELGTVAVQGDDLYPIRPGAGSSGQTGSSTGGSSGQTGGSSGGNTSDEARLRAQIQAILDREQRGK